MTDFIPTSPRHIFVNQVGYATHAIKRALIVAESCNEFSLYDSDQHCVLTKPLAPAQFSSLCGFHLQMVDFSEVVKSGRYTLRIGIYNQELIIKELPYELTAKALLKAFYFQRSSLELLPTYAGPWARPLGHPDNHVVIHASAASTQRPEGTLISSSKGWYDAGDYNKYIVNSGISTSTLLSAFEDLGSFTRELQVNIPESAGDLPDLLAEARWNLDWMLTMQDPHDGGVYSKLTNRRFDDMVLPHLCTEPRFVVLKTTAAALDFAATMAQAARVYKPWQPEWAHTCLHAAQQAYLWAQRNPAVYFAQPTDIFTGHYSDSCIEDEFYWAEMALYNTTSESRWLVTARTRQPRYGIPSWQSVGTLGLLECLRRDPHAPERQIFLTECHTFLQTLASEPLGIPMQVSDFEWGSNGVVANQGMMLLFAHKLTGELAFREAAHQLFDYLLGRNPLGFCYVSGVGLKSPLNLHHRPSHGDSLTEPVPGLLAGGPNPRQQDADKCPPYPSKSPAMSYLDHVSSCASNEIAINWNAPAFYLAAGLCESL